MVKRHNLLGNWIDRSLGVREGFQRLDIADYDLLSFHSFENIWT